jgi:MFS family permease
MSFAKNKALFFLIFFIYGIYAAATEGVAKAWITNICDKVDTATAIGSYTAFQSVCSLLASSFAGIIWFSFGSSITFIITAAMSIGVIVYLAFLPERWKDTPKAV